MIHKEANQEMDDRQLRIAINKRNEIENSIYTTRIKMHDEMANYISEEEKKALPPLMDEVETWLYSGDELVYDKNILESKCSKLIELTGKLYGRYHNWNNLDETVSYLEKYNLENINKVNQICESNMKDFIKSDDMFNLISNSNQQLNELKVQMNKTPKFMDAPTTAEKLRKDYDELNKVIFILITKNLNNIYNLKIIYFLIF